jgi:nitrogen fixation protein NifZ
VAVDELELDLPPAFALEEKVRIKKLIRNDGTFPGKEIGETLAKKGDIGYIVGIGTYLQSFYIYSVHFIETNFVVGCRKRELESAEVIEEATAQ